MLASAPFDNWWHNAYGLDVAIFSPPHVVLDGGVLAIQVGAVVLMASTRNHSPGRSAREGSIGSCCLWAELILMLAMTVAWEIHLSRADAHATVLSRDCDRCARRARGICRNFRAPLGFHDCCSHLFRVRDGDALDHSAISGHAEVGTRLSERHPHGPYGIPHSVDRACSLPRSASPANRGVDEMAAITGNGIYLSGHTADGAVAVRLFFDFTGVRELVLRHEVFRVFFPTDWIGRAAPVFPRGSNPCPFRFCDGAGAGTRDFE